LAIACALILAVPAFAQRTPSELNQKVNPQILAAMAEVVTKPSLYTVVVNCQKKEAALGTIVGTDGWIVTKASEMKLPITVKLKDGRELDARLVGFHTDYDLAMLKVDATGLPVAEWKNSKEATTGSWVATVGQGKEPLNIGVISVETRNMPKEPPRPKPNSGFLGIMMDAAEGGVLVKEVMKDTAASKCGLKVNDIIVGVDEKTIKSREAIQEMLSSRKAGDDVMLKIMREGKEMTLKATLGKREADRGDIQNSMGSKLSDRRNNFPIILQHDTVIKPTECGGPLVDLDGKVVGINIARAGRVESYAVPSEIVQSLQFDLATGKYPPPAEVLNGATPADRLIIAEYNKTKAEAAKAAADKQIKDADSAIAKAKSDIDAEKKKKEQPKVEDKKPDSKDGTKTDKK
jgi:serine protease Do